MTKDMKTEFDRAMKLLSEAYEILNNIGISALPANDTSALPAIGISAEECTWRQIKAISEAGRAPAYFKCGDTKVLTLIDGTAITMEIVAFNRDRKPTNAKAGITWLSKDIIAFYQMNNTCSNKDGWKASRLRDWLQNEFFARLPVDVQDVIAPVQKTFYNHWSRSVLLCQDNLWIPSVQEIFGNDSYEVSAPNYADYLTDRASRVKSDSSGLISTWWLRSASGGNDFCFKAVYDKGTFGPSNALRTNGVVVGFCT